MRNVPRPRYRLCWWCNRQLWGRQHAVLRALEAPSNTEVIVHLGCAERMQREGDWEEVVNAA